MKANSPIAAIPLLPNIPTADCVISLESINYIICVYARRQRSSVYTRSDIEEEELAPELDHKEKFKRVHAIVLRRFAQP
jgi:hypothetical protein